MCFLHFERHDLTFTSCDRGHIRHLEEVFNFFTGFCIEFSFIDRNSVAFLRIFRGRCLLKV